MRTIAIITIATSLLMIIACGGEKKEEAEPQPETQLDTTDEQVVELQQPVAKVADKSSLIEQECPPFEGDPAPEDLAAFMVELDQIRITEPKSEDPTPENFGDPAHPDNCERWRRLATDPSSGPMLAHYTCAWAIDCPAE